MDSIAWIQVLPALLGGGAAGAVISTAVTARRARIQPVGHRIEVVPVFRQTVRPSSMRAKLALTEGEETKTFENLFLADVQVVNRGNQDITEFNFGVTLDEG